MTRRVIVTSTRLPLSDEDETHLCRMLHGHAMGGTTRVTRGRLRGAERREGSRWCWGTSGTGTGVLGANTGQERLCLVDCGGCIPW